MAEEKEAFLSRWSRMKREPVEEKKAEPETPASALPPSLPPMDSVTPDSDFAGFMHPKVKDELRRLALKKLFSDPHFNIPDPFEPFSGDWTGEALPPDMLAKLNQARTLIFDEPQNKPKDEEKPAEEPVAAKVEEETKQDEPGRQDT